MSLRLLCLVAVLGVAGSGCYSPRVKNLGFACNSSDPDPCPSGFQCIAGLCDDGSGGRAPARVDMSLPVAVEDMASPPKSKPDLAQPIVHDLAMPIGPDMTQPPDLMPACQPVGGACTKSADCCSGHCHSFSTLVCF